MSISTLKLSRITLSALDGLRQNPKSVENALDAYQGRIRGDRSAGDNLRRSAASLESFFNNLEDGVSAGFNAYKDYEEGEAFEAWQQSSPKEKETWRENVKSGSVSPGSSPFFNKGLETMLANDHIQRYQLAFSTNATLERTSATPNKKYLNDDGVFDILKFSESHLDEYQRTHGLTNFSGASYAVFAKGIGPVHANAFAKQAAVQETMLLKKHVDAFGATTLQILKNAETPEAFGRDVDALFKSKVVDTGVLKKDYIEKVEAVVRTEYLERILAGDKDAEGIIHALGEMSTGDDKQKYKDLPAYAVKVRALHLEGERAAANRLSQVDTKRQLGDAEFGESFMKEFGEHPGDNASFFDDPKNAHYLAKAMKWANSSDPKRANLANQILATRYGGIPDVMIEHMTPELLRLPKVEAIAQFNLSNPTKRQVDEFTAVYDNFQQAQTGRDGTVYKASKKKWIGHTNENQGTYIAGGVPDSKNDVELTRRAGWHRELDDERQRTLTAAITNVDPSLSIQDRQALLSVEVDKVNTAYDEGMQAKYDEFVTEQKAIQEKAQKDAAVARTRYDYLANMGDNGISEFMRGDYHIDNQQRLLKDAINSAPKEGEEPSPFHTRALLNADKALMRSARFKQAAESLGLKPTHENIVAVSEQIKLMLSDIYGPDGPDKKEITDEQKKEIQETMWQGIKGVLTNTTDSLLNLTPEFVQEGANDGLAGIQSIAESLPENTLEVIKTLSDGVTEGKDALNISDAADAVGGVIGDALLGKEAFASDTPETNTGASDSQLTTTEKIAFDKQAKQAEAAQSNDKAFMDDLLGVKPPEEPMKPEDVIPSHLREKLGKEMVWTDTVMTPAQKAAGTVADGNGGVNTKKAFDKHFGEGKFAEVKAEQRKQFALQTKKLSEHFAPSIGKHIKPEWVQNMWMHETKHGNSVLAGTYNLGNIKGSYNGKSGKFEVHEYLSKKDIKKHEDAGTFVKLGEGYRDGKRKVYIKDDFRQYPNFVEAATDFVRLLNKPRYTKVKEAKTQREFVTALHAAGYMTDSVEKYLAGLNTNDKVKRG